MRFHSARYATPRVPSQMDSLDHAMCLYCHLLLPYQWRALFTIHSHLVYSKVLSDLCRITQYDGLLLGIRIARGVLE